jgi:hypothetical protein
VAQTGRQETECSQFGKDAYSEFAVNPTHQAHENLQRLRSYPYVFLDTLRRAQRASGFGKTFFSANPFSRSTMQPYNW